MFIKAIASVAFAALLLTGPAASVPSSSAREVPATMQTTEPTTQVPEAELTPQEAAAIALEHAGLVETDTKLMRIKLKIDDGVPEYEVKFLSNDQKYEYSIHAVTGEILEWEAESWCRKAHTEKKKDHEQNKPPVEDETVAPALTADEAQAIALAHAGLTAEQVTCLRSKFDLDDGVPTWEVEFRAGDLEYDYTIHAETGEILEWDSETASCEDCPEKGKGHGKKQDNTQPPAQDETKPAGPALTEEEAQAIALAHAGLTAEEVTFEPTELDRERGALIYEVEFRVGNWEYSYEIHAETGEILEWEKEIDD